MLVQLRLCAACADVLRQILAKRGEEVMAEAVGPTLQACPTCRAELPPIRGTLVTKLKLNGSHHAR